MHPSSPNLIGPLFLGNNRVGIRGSASYWPNSVYINEPALQHKNGSECVLVSLSHSSTIVQAPIPLPLPGDGLVVSAISQPVF